MVGKHHVLNGCYNWNKSILKLTPHQVWTIIVNAKKLIYGQHHHQTNYPVIQRTAGTQEIAHLNKDKPISLLE